MGLIQVTERDNIVIVTVVGFKKTTHAKGSLTASTGTLNGTVTLFDDFSNSYIARNHPFASYIDNSRSAYGNSTANTVTALNNIVNATPEVFIKGSNTIADLTGISSGDFDNTKGNRFVVATGTNEGISTQSTVALNGSGDVVLASNVLVTGNISVTGTVDGVDIAASVYDDSDADARIAAASIEDLSDVPALGTAGQVLAVNSGASALEYVNNDGAGVTEVTGTSPVVSSGGTTPAISITASTTTAAGSMSSADKVKLNGIAAGAEVNAVDSVNTQTGDVVLDTDDIAEGTTNEYFTDARVAANSAVVANTAKTGITSSQASAITANTAKVGITSTQASNITTNNSKVGITSSQASAITANTAKTTFPGFGTSEGTALEGDTALLELGTTSSTALAGNTTTITSSQASAITANTAKVGITTNQSNAITANTAKTGITSGQASAITANTSKTGITSGQASAITANTAKTSFPGFGTSAGTALEGDTSLLQLGTTSTTALAGDTTTISTAQANAITANTAKVGITSGQASAITANTAKTGITSTQASDITANNAKTGITSGQASAITANTAKVSYTDASAVAANTAKVGITTQQASDITTNNAKVGITSTQASNITTNNAKIATVADDPSPQLGENLDVQAREINTSTTDGNIKLNPNGTGCVEIMGVGASTGAAGAIQLNCSNNNHGVKIQSPPHSAGATYTLTLPTSNGSNGQYMTTDGSGNLAFSTFVLPDLAVGTDNIQDDAVTADHILDDTVGPAELANTTVTAGSYTNTNITVDAQGRVTSASSGSGGSGGTLTAVTGTLPIVSSGGNTPAISINAASASAAGSMSAAHFQHVNTSSGAYTDSGETESKDIVLTVDDGISGADELIVSCMQDTTADNTNTNAKDLLGVSKGANDQVVLRGIIELSSLINGATAGRPLWLGTSGTFVSAAPTADNSYSRIVGHSLGTTQSGSLVYFNPSPDWVQIDNP